MTSTISRPANGVKCGNCKLYHLTVGDVRRCYQGETGLFGIAVNGETTRPAAQLPKTGPLATPKQVSYLRALCEERDTTLEAECDTRTLTVDGASTLIKELLSQPKAKGKLPSVQEMVKQTAAALPDVPAGRYAIREDSGENAEDSAVAEVIRFYRVDRPTEGRYKGRTFLKVQASDDFHPVREFKRMRAVLEAIAKDTAGASKLYGTELGHCGVCGRTLTDETSRSNGIGPVCAGKMGW